MNLYFLRDNDDAHFGINLFVRNCDILPLKSFEFFEQIEYTSKGDGDEAYIFWCRNINWASRANDKRTQPMHYCYDSCPLQCHLINELIRIFRIFPLFQLTECINALDSCLSVYKLFKINIYLHDVWNNYAPIYGNL